MLGKDEQDRVDAKKEEIYDDDDLSGGGESLCSESSWDPNEDDSLELEIDDQEKQELKQAQVNKPKNKIAKYSTLGKDGSEINEKSFDSYGDDAIESEGEEEESKGGNDNNDDSDFIYDDDQFDSEDDPFLSN